MPASEWLAAQNSGKEKIVQVSPEFEAWSAARLAGFTIPEWFALDRDMRTLVVAFYRATKIYDAVVNSVDDPGKP